MRFFPFSTFLFFSLYLLLDVRVNAQSNASTVTNSAAPSAMSQTTGGSNTTFQSNNTYNNEFGLSPGIFCRTPALFMSGNFVRNDSDNYFSASAEQPSSYNDTWNYGGQIGVVFPFGSSVIDHCKTVARQIAVDKSISTELSLIRTCAALVKEKITIDPVKFPLLKPCIIKKGEPVIYQSASKVVKKVPSVKMPKISQ